MPGLLSQERQRARPPPVRWIFRSNSSIRLTTHVSAASRRKRSAKTTAKLLNSIPLPSSRRRPTPTLWAFGAGGNGQLGLGTKHLDEFAKPVRQIWVEGCREGRKLGASDGAGFEKIAVGGMHTLAIDELGRVSACFHGSDNDSNEFYGTFAIAGLDMGCERRRGVGSIDST